LSDSTGSGGARVQSVGAGSVLSEGHVRSEGHVLSEGGDVPDVPAGRDENTSILSNISFRELDTPNWCVRTRSFCACFTPNFRCSPHPTRPSPLTTSHQLPTISHQPPCHCTLQV
jgi:hypothetical protein